jgi:hypothetical protein
MNYRLPFLLITGVFLSLNGRWVSAKDHVVCHVLSTSSSVEESGRDVSLVLTLENRGGSAIDIPEYSLGSNMLHMRAKVVQGGRQMTPVLPLISPGIHPIRMAAGGKVTRKVSLVDVFPELPEVLRTSDVEVSWTLDINPDENCFTKSETVTVRIPKIESP